RKDLASKGDPDAPRTTQSSAIPLIWQAAQMNAIKCLVWLSGPGPLEAYTEYMATSKDEHASSLKRMKDFEQRLPILLGATPTQLGEHVVFAHINSGEVKKETLKHLFDIFAKDATVFVHKKLEGLEVTPLLYICGQNFNEDIFDFFFERGADVLNSTYERGYVKLMKHVFTRLSQDQLSTLLSQTTRRKLNTPLMIAIKTGNLEVVEFLLSFDHPVTNASLLARDANGSLPIHEATSKEYHKILELMLRSKSAQAMKALFTENGIGSTPLEIATFKYLLSFDRKLQNDINGNAAVQYTIPSPVIANLSSGPWSNARHLLQGLKQILEQLPQINRTTIDEYRALEKIVVSVDEEGRLTNSPTLLQVLREYIERSAIALEDSNTALAQKKRAYDELTAIYTSAEAAVSPSVLGQTASNDYTLNSLFGRHLYGNRIGAQSTTGQDVGITYNVIRSAVESSGLKRRRGLVHLLDAQTAVNSAMDIAINAPNRDPGFTFGQTQGYSGSFRRRQRNFAKMEALGPEEDQSNKFNYILNYSSMVSIGVE
ncbi:2298_t:CDS:2, partial [Acaulospora colombiana]